MAAGFVYACIIAAAPTRKWAVLCNTPLDIRRPNSLLIERARICRHMSNERAQQVVRCQIMPLCVHMTRAGKMVRHPNSISFGEPRTKLHVAKSWMSANNIATHLQGTGETQQCKDHRAPQHSLADSRHFTLTLAVLGSRSADAYHSWFH